MSVFHGILSYGVLKILSLFLVFATGGWAGTLLFRHEFWKNLVVLEFEFYSRFSWIPKGYLEWQRRFCLSHLFRVTVFVLFLLSVLCAAVLFLKTGRTA